LVPVSFSLADDPDGISPDKPEPLTHTRYGNLYRITRLQYITHLASVKLYHQIQYAILVMVSDIGPPLSLPFLGTSKKKKDD